ncbi:killer cell lectin-like receptor subfamily F member 1 [Emydura macquarii macquarii]|uniref:killer cell lectin-like receptor subfamily F member 1 n=1 Tax=Emydura macquarii macquarii TaxID=1129001 RepID=UPI00352AB98E
MAGETIYADLNIHGDSSPLSRPQPPQCLECHQFPRWHRIALGVGWAGNIILLGAVMALSVWVFQGPCSKAETGAALRARESDGVTGRNGNGTDYCLVSHLRQRLCDSPQNGSAEGSGCKLCPLNWLLHGDKCYWVSKDSKNWNESHDYCSAKNSQMLMFQNQDEREFIKNITEGKYPVWSGLHLTTSKGNLTWVDGSLLNQATVSLSAPDTGNSCGVWKENQIRGEICSGDFKWICQRDAVLI